MIIDKKIYRSDMIRCVLCEDAPCSAVCGKTDPAALLRSIWFGNEKNAAASLSGEDTCGRCPAPCEEACVRMGEVPIRKLMVRLRKEVLPELEITPDRDDSILRTDICGVSLENPFLLSSSVVSST